ALPISRRPPSLGRPSLPPLGVSASPQGGRDLAPPHTMVRDARAFVLAFVHADGLASARLGEQDSERSPVTDPARLRGLTMTVDQADDVAARTAVGGGRPRHAAALHPWPDASPAGHGPDAPAGGHAAVAVEPGLAGQW